MSRINLDNYEAFLLDLAEGNLSQADAELLKLFVDQHPELEIDLEDFSLPYFSGQQVNADFKPSLRKTDGDLQNEEIIRYVENLLTTKQRAAFELRLKSDSNLKRELLLFKKTILTSDHREESGIKDQLLKTDDDLILNNTLLAYFENQLTGADKILFEQTLKADAGLQQDLELFEKTRLSADPSVVFPDKKSLRKKNKLIVLWDLKVASMAAALLLLIGFVVVFMTYQSGLVNQRPAGIASASIKGDPEKIKTTPDEKKAESKEPVSGGNTISVPVAKKTIPNQPNKIPSTNTSNATLQKSGLASLETENLDVTAVEKKEIKTLVQSSVIAKESAGDTVTSETTYLTAFEDLEVEEELTPEKLRNKKSLWKRAVQLAKQANKLGVKSIDGEENIANTYRLSFNSFSVEKK